MASGGKGVLSRDDVVAGGACFATTGAGACLGAGAGAGAGAAAAAPGLYTASHPLSSGSSLQSSSPSPHPSPMAGAGLDDDDAMGGLCVVLRPCCAGFAAGALLVDVGEVARLVLSNASPQSPACSPPLCELPQSFALALCDSDDDDDDAPAPPGVLATSLLTASAAART